MRAVFISDTHCKLAGIAVPDGDLLVHCGDATMGGSLKEWSVFAAVLSRLPHPHRVVIAGNHDILCQKDPATARSLLEGVATYLQDEEATIAGLRVYGSPWQPRFFNWAFNLDRGEPLRKVWAKIPSGLDLLVTHGPPHGIGDVTLQGTHAGCRDLLAAVRRARPRYHAFGHFHEGHGTY